MTSMEPFCHAIGIETHCLSREESFLLEAECYTRLCAALKKLYKEKYKPYFRFIRSHYEKEETMLDANLIRLVIDDIVQSEEYSLAGIAYYTETSLEVISDIASGQNISPSLMLSRKIIELHRSIRPELYRNTIKKIIEEYSK